ncbi:histidinol dehydrogenase, partial [Streptomyces sp. NPDC048845]
MISRIDLRGAALPEGSALRDLLPRADFDVEAALDKVRPICEDVRHRGTAALIDYAQRFDGVTLDRIRVPAEALTRALAELDPAVRAALEESVRRARLVHREQRRTDHTTQVVPGGTVTERWVPVERVGLYVPGGL